MKDVTCREKRRLLDARRGKCRVRLGSHLEEWCQLKEHLGFSLHSQLAKFLLDSYRSAASPDRLACNLGRAVPAAISLISASLSSLQNLVLSCHQHGRDCPCPPSLLSYPHVRGVPEAHVIRWGCTAKHHIDWEPQVDSTGEENKIDRQDKLSDSNKDEVIKLKAVSRQAVNPKSDCMLPSCAELRCDRLDISFEGTKIQPESINSQEREKVIVNRQGKLPLSPDKMTDIVNGKENKSLSGSPVDEMDNTSLTEEQLKSGLCEETLQHSPIDKSWQELNENLLSSESGNQDVSKDIGCPDNKYVDVIERPSESSTSVKEAPKRVPINSIKRTLCNLRKGKSQRHRQLPESSVQVQAEHDGLAMAVNSRSPSSVKKGVPADALEKSKEDQTDEYLQNEESYEKLINSGAAQDCDCNATPDAPTNTQACTKTEERSQEILESQESSKANFTVDWKRKEGTGSEDNHPTASHRSHVDEEEHTCKKRIRKSTPQELLLCEIDDCGRIFSKRQYLNYHQKYQHMNQRTFCCSAPGCGRSFNFKKHLKEHEKRHSGRRDFICEFCAHAFISNSNLIVHRRIHTGEKPLQCEFCGFTCRQKASLNWHMKKHDADAFYQFPCDICGQRFEKRDNLAAHRSRKHPVLQETSPIESVQSESTGEIPQEPAPCCKDSQTHPASREIEMTTADTSQEIVKVAIFPECPKPVENIQENTLKVSEVNKDEISLVIVL
ncbi:zinc finger protein 692-like isoform X2 [Pelobates fuscus]|uniref:zinc finger protein 692-like isoform X2 n=1 Tax=Pelobates fuscus TaxID=191477 RepID=UPI002FE46F26